MPRLPKYFQPAENNKKRKRSSNEQLDAVTSYATVGGDTGVHTSQIETLSSEREKIGLFELSTAETSNNVDVVAVHGLQGDAYKTWMHEIGTLWLRDLLPAEIPSARIMTFGYESAWAFSNSVSGIEHKAFDLLNRLSAKRNYNTHRRPLVFICHSLGGIIVKKALILAHERSSYSDFRDILSSTKAIAFLAVPHKGSGTAWWGNFVANVLKGVSIGFSTNPALVADLRKNSSALTDIQKQSIERIKHLKMYTFYETLRLQGVLVGTGYRSGQRDLYLTLSFRLLTNRRHCLICRTRGRSRFMQIMKRFARSLQKMINYTKL